MASSITSPITATFNGTSTYASSLQQVISRAVSFAALPLQQLENQYNDTQNKIAAAQSLQQQVTAVNAAVQALAGASGNLASASVSDNSVLQATTSAGALPGTYVIDVTQAGSYSSSMSANGLPTVTDPSTQNISQSSSFTLTVGGSTYTIQPPANNLSALATAINSSGAGVQATVINIGGPSQPDYRLALQSSTLGPVSIQLNDGSSDLMSTLTTGTNTVYTVNGQPSGGISTNTNTVTVAPGLTVNLLSAGTATIQVAANATSISNALNSFVTAFNNAQAELAKSYGQNAGALSGDSAVPQTSRALSQIAGYLTSGNITSLADLGVTFNKDGTLSFDSSKINSVSATDLATFLGGATTGGFLQAATNTLNGLLDTTSGLIPSEINVLNNESTQQQQQIQDEQSRITDLQNSITEQMAAADAQIAALEQQTTFLTQLFNTMNANNNAGH
jgi:flagellar hook-associated protein 2